MRKPGLFHGFIILCLHIFANQVICEFLKDSGYKVTASFDGESGAERFFENQYDLVILDIMLPCKTGMEVLKEIRELSNVPVIMLTALADEYTQIKGFDKLAVNYITKPFSTKLVLKRVEALLRRTSSDVLIILKRSEG